MCRLLTVAEATDGPLMPQTDRGVQMTSSVGPPWRQERIVDHLAVELTLHRLSFLTQVSRLLQMSTSAHV